MSNHHSSSKQKRILSFWFGDDPLHPLENSPIWFNKDPKIDAIVLEIFGDLLAEASTGAFDDWSKTPDGALALIVLCDQMSRHIFRDDERAFEQDSRALKTAQIAIAHGFEAYYSNVQRVFLYLPFEHSERLEMQERSLEFFQNLQNLDVSAATAEERNFIESAVSYARQHHEIIARFGRFPHRNDILGRESSRPEQDFLKRAGSSF
jgi:uncharacterized protein (DUF924 family)